MPRRACVLSTMLAAMTLAGAVLAAAAPAIAPAEGDLARSAPPPWVRPVSWSESAAPLSSTGYVDRLWDYQVNVDTQESYFHFVYLIASAGAVSDGASVSMSFDPAYQSVTLHAAKRWRPGTALSQENADFKKIQREQSLEESTYGGEQTWLAFLKDVQVGDTIEVAYTVRGFNPIFQGRYCDTFRLQGTSPVQRSSLRVLHDAARTPVFKTFNTTELGRETTNGSAAEFSITLADVPALEYEPSLAVGFQPGVRIDISEFASWAEVASWGTGLFAAPADDAVLAKTRLVIAGAPAAGGAASGATAAGGAALALLRYVQDDIRYLGIETGVNSHQPRAPGEVLANRFGDCKDKVALFCSMARASGFEAWPVLVHTWRQGLVADDIPSPLAFNHVIAALAWNGGVLYLDPTRSMQGGTLEESALGDFGWGLVLRPGTGALQQLPAPRASSIRRTDLFHVKDLGGGADLDVTYQYTGESADNFRAWLAEQDPAALRKAYTEEFHDQYGEVSLTRDPAASDDRAADSLWITVGFRVAKLLTTEGKRVQFEIYPSQINDRLRDPQTVTRRTQPMYFEHPLTIVQDQVLETPLEWGLKPSNENVEDPSFLVTSAVTSSGTTVSVHSVFTSLRDRVNPADWERYLADLKKARQTIGWTVWTEPKGLAGSGTPPDEAATSPVRPVTGGEPAANWAAGAGAFIVSVVVFLLAALNMGGDF